MKFLLLFMFVSVVMATEQSESSQDALVRSFTRIFGTTEKDGLECIRKTEVTREDLRYMEDSIDLSETEPIDMKRMKKASCAIVCCAQKIGVMVGREIQVEKLFRYFRKTGMPEDIESPLRDVVRTCKQEVKDTTDECILGYKFIKCVFDKNQVIWQQK